MQSSCQASDAQNPCGKDTQSDLASQDSAFGPSSRCLAQNARQVTSTPVTSGSCWPYWTDCMLSTRSSNLTKAVAQRCMGFKNNLGSGELRSEHSATSTRSSTPRTTHFRSLSSAAQCESWALSTLKALPPCGFPWMLAPPSGL